MLLLLLACATKDPAKTDDTAAPPDDTGEPEDTAPPADTPDDSAPPNDTAPPDDTAEPDDTAPPDDTDTAPPEAGWRSALYPEDWEPGFAVDDKFLHDFSYAGYHNGEDPPPASLGLVFSALDYGADASGAADSCPAIQAAIDAAEAAGAGVVYLPAGEYRCDDLLRVTASNVVIEGDGSGKTRLYFTRGASMSDTDHLTFAGSPVEGAEYALAADGAPLSAVVAVADASGLSPGDDVSVGWTITDEFVADHGMTGVWAVSNGQWRSFFRRTVLAVDTSVTPNTVTLDVPLRYPALTRDGASLRVEAGYISECGVRGLAISTVVEWSEAWSNERSHAIGFSGVKDCWMEDVISYESPNSSDTRGKHLQNGGVLVVTSKRVTIAGSTLEQAQNRGDGGSGYLFEISRSSEILIADSTARAGRHNFIQNWDFGASGCVFLRTKSEDGAAVYSADAEWLTWLGNSEFHHSLAMANLIDESVTTDGWKAANRQDESSGAGHSATQDVFWNLSGTGSLVSYQYGYGYIIGTSGVSVTTTVWDVFDSEGTAPEDYTEGLDQGADLEPQSLYDDQLARRLARGEALWGP